jgi:hypothetical protein
MGGYVSREQMRQRISDMKSFSGRRHTLATYNLSTEYHNITTVDRDILVGRYLFTINPSTMHGAIVPDVDLLCSVTLVNNVAY